MRQTMKRRLRPIRSMTILTIVAGLFMVAQPNADAITLVPTDLNPGDTYHLVFLTSTTIDATSPFISDYDSFVQDVADNAGTGIGSSEGFTWRAIVSTPGTATNAIDHVVQSGPVYRLDDTRVANDTELFGVDLIAAININEKGDTISALTDIWTGTNPDGSAHATFELGTSTPTVGSQNTSGITTSLWIFKGQLTQDEELPLYAISEALTNPIPEPSTMLLLGTGLAGLVAWRMRKDRA